MVHYYKHFEMRSDLGESGEGGAFIFFYISLWPIFGGSKFLISFFFWLLGKTKLLRRFLEIFDWGHF